MSTDPHRDLHQDAIDAEARVWSRVVAFIRARCGVVLGDDQRYLLDARLGAVAARLGYPSIERLVAAATAAGAADADEAAAQVIDAMTTHETSFFRDAGFWAAFAAQVVPALEVAARTRRPRIWSAACATGQEPYSIAMVLAERAPRLVGDVELIATDVSAPALERARAGVYSGFEASRGLDAARVAAHLAPAPGGLRVRAGLRAAIRFARHNLLDDAPAAAGCDVILCRNVLVYLGDDERRRAIAALERAVRPGGWIGVGAGEVLAGTPAAPGWYRRG